MTKQTKAHLHTALVRARQIATTYTINRGTVQGDPSRAFGYLERSVAEYLGEGDKDRPALQVNDDAAKQVTT